MWQDYLMMVGGIMFSIALIPCVRGEGKPDWRTSLLTGGILASYVPALATRGLVLSSAATAATATIWFVLLYQVLRRSK